MGKTILDLFQSKILSSGKTAEETYDIRNSKDIPISTTNLLINNTSVPAINLVRRNVGVRSSETRLEQELVGLRPLSQLSSPFLYGTAILRITQQKSDQTEKMKQAVGGNVGGSGVIGGLIERVGDRVNDKLDKLGVKFPSQLNPTSYAEKLEVDDKSRIPKILSDIKNNSSGNTLGRVLSQPQTPNQLVRSTAGLAVGAIKNRVRGALFGERSTTGFNTANLSGNFLMGFNYGSNSQFNPTTQIPNEDESINRAGSTYSSGFNRNIEFQSSLVDASLENFKIRRVNQGIQSLNDSGDDFTKRYTDFIAENRINLQNKPSKATFNTDNETVDTTVGLANKIPSIIIPHKEVRPEGKKLYSQLRAKDSLTQRGILYDNGRYVGDVLNNRGVNPTETTIDGVRNLDDIDLIPLKFTLLSNRRTIYFRSLIDGISETLSPSWDSAKFIGNPFSFYTYSGVERSVSFNLKVAATTPNELKRNWERLSFLSSMVYPAGYQSNTYVIPPFIKFTLGNLYKAKEGFIESLSYTVDDTAGWEIGNEDDMKEYKLPKKIDVSIGIKFLETRNNTDNYAKLYSFGSVT